MNKDTNLPMKMGLALGAAMGVVVVSIAIVRYRTGMILRGDHTLTYAYWTIFTTAVFLAVFRFKKIEPQAFVFSKPIKIGLFAGLVSGTLYTIYIVMLNNFIDTELPAKILELNRREIAQANPELTAAEVDSRLGVNKISSAARGMIYVGVCMTFGSLHSFLATILARKIK